MINRGLTSEAASRDGITIGMIDAIITLANALHERLMADSKRFKRSEDRWFSEDIQDALSDLRHNMTINSLLYPRDESSMALINEAAERLKPKIEAAKAKKIPDAP